MRTKNTTAATRQEVEEIYLDFCIRTGREPSNREAAKVWGWSKEAENALGFLVKVSLKPHSNQLAKKVTVQGTVTQARLHSIKNNGQALYEVTLDSGRTVYLTKITDQR